MYEKYMIMTRGFKNVRQNGDVIGFEFNIRTTYYRGTVLTIISGLEVKVDGEAVQPDQLRFTVRGKQFTLDEMTREEKTYWPFGEPATVTVLKKGGLDPGMHDIFVQLSIFPAYMPPPGFVARNTRKMTLVQ